MNAIRRVSASLLLTCLGNLALASSGVVMSISNQNDMTLLKDGVPVCRNTFSIFPTYDKIVPLVSSTTSSTTVQSIGSYNGVTFTINTSSTSDSTGATVTMTAWPSADINVANVFLSAMLPDTEWVDGTANVGGASVSLPRSLSSLTLYSGVASQIQVARPDGFGLNMTLPTQQNVLLQDSRQWMPYFEARVGAFAGLWHANEVKTWRIRFSTNAGSIVGDTPFVVNGSNWVPVSPSLDIVAGSALDLSPATVTPAGSKGWVIVNADGKFAFSSTPTVPQRFYGANVLYSALYTDHTMADRLADRMMRMGYNLVRLHHYDEMLVAHGVGNSTTIDPNQLDKLNYLVYALKKRGMYVMIDLYSTRQILDNEIFPGTVDMNDFKLLYQVSPAARQNLLTFATNLLNSMNPYTGLRWKEDPAIAWIDLVNEDGTHWVSQWARPEVQAVMNQAYLAAGGSGSYDPNSDEGAKFAAQKNAEAYNWMKSQLRSLGVRALLTDSNYCDATAMAAGRSQVDYADSHHYWDHPNFYLGNWTVPFTQRADSQLSHLDALGTLAMTRVAGKPFTVSELDMVAPNQYRAEMGLIVGAVASAQDWDAIARFEFAQVAERLTSPQALTAFDMSTDPLNMATERAAVMLYLRKHLNTSLPRATWLISGSNVGARNFDPPLQGALMSYALSSSVSQGDPSGVSPVNDNGLKSTPDGKVVADVYQDKFSVNTPQTCGFIADPGVAMTAGALRGTASGSRATVWVSSLDGRPITTSRRMLLTHLTDLQNTNATFTSQSRTLMTDWGVLPYLAADGNVSITLSMQNASKARVFRLDMTGRRIASVSVTKSSGTIRFNATMRGPNGATFYYEITG